MKPIQVFRCLLVMVALCLSLAGCIYESHTWTEQLQNGYYTVTHHRSYLAEAAPTHTDLRYQSSDGKSIRVWPAVDKVIVHEHTAVFTDTVGDLLTFDPPGPTVDITRVLTERVVKEFGLKTNGVPFYTVLVATLKENEGGMKLGLATFLPEGDVTANITWEDLANMSDKARVSNRPK